jgi:hypothetical protein
MLLFGFADPTHISVDNLTMDRETVPIGESLRFTFDLRVDTPAPSKVRLEYVVEYARPKGKTSRKVFQLKEGSFDPGSHFISRERSFADQSTRKHYPGQHSISIIVNGVEKAAIAFELTS